MTMRHRLLASFTGPETLIETARRAPGAGLRVVSLNSPFPIDVPDDVFALLEKPRPWRDRVAAITLVGGLTGAALGYGMQWYANVVDYPIVVAGRPPHSWPAFIPVTFELTVLGAALAGGLGMLALNGLPRLHHRLFGVPGFERASRDLFFLEVELTTGVALRVARQFLEASGALGVTEVPDELRDAG